MMKYIRSLKIGILFYCFFIAGVPSMFAQESKSLPFDVMFYNVENLFDCRDDSLHADEEFTPRGLRGWKYDRYKTKLNQIAKVIAAAGEWDTPALIGLCEVENNAVLTDLLRNTPLRSELYQSITAEGNDMRGINCALIYRRDLFKYINHQEYVVRFSVKMKRTTRNLLHVSGELLSGDTLDVFVAHFPSRSAGQKQTEVLRCDVASLLRSKVDSICTIRTNPQCIIMGDFNDTPSDKSMISILQAQMPEPPFSPQVLYNLFAVQNPHQHSGGTHKFQGEWAQLDQMIVTGNLLSGDNPLRAKNPKGAVLSFPFLLTRDDTHGGKRPFRTYHGYKYEGGFSDHLPIIARFSIYL